MKKRKVIWDDEAKRSLRSIYDYIASRESERVGKKVVREISRQVKTLSAHSEKFAIEPNLSKMDGNFRFKVVWSYKIIYEVAIDYVLVLDIFHTSRDPSEIRK